jgi:hypothetical protein
MTTLPISKETLIYGSNDGGKTMHCCDDIHEIIVEIGKKLGLKSHLVSDKQMALCGDIEIHQIPNEIDGNVFYALDEQIWHVYFLLLAL